MVKIFWICFSKKYSYVAYLRVDFYDSLHIFKQADKIFKNISKLSHISTADLRIYTHKRKQMTKPAYLAIIYVQTILQSLLREANS